MRVTVDLLPAPLRALPGGVLLLSLLLLLSGVGCSGSTGDDDTAGDDDDTSSEPTPVDADQDGASSDVDCDDDNAAIYPGAEERCDGIDQDCDLALDEDAVDAASFYEDEDGDGFGAGAVQGEGCVPPAGQVTNEDDCDDDDDEIHPDADDVCNGIDDDCDDRVDDGAAATWYRDFDGDGFGNPDNVETSCEEPEGYVEEEGDCDDTDASIHEGATEVCNGVDDNCNGRKDEGAEGTWYADSDGDGYGDAAVSSEACPAPSGYVADDSDCEDGDGAVHPDATETCDGADEDCDGELDEGFDRSNYHPDLDGDGYGDSAVTEPACEQPEDHVEDGTDCDDDAADVHPGAGEQCNSIDDDCDGTTDEEVIDQTFYPDEDGDGYGSSTGAQIACKAPDGHVLNADDCNDDSAAVNPGAAEVCNSIDDDCDGQKDETGENTFYKDGDKDGYGDPAQSTKACSRPSGYVTSGTDCNDADANIRPGATERCNFLDDDCDGTADDGLTLDALAAGEAHSLALCSDGTVLAWGFNGSGQLGDKTFDNRSTPVPVSGLSGVTAIAAGTQHSLAVRKDGTVWAWGYNGSGQLGDATASSRNVPTQVKLSDDPRDPDDLVIYLSEVVGVAGGADHSLFLRKDGTVWAAGANTAGQLGNGSTSDSRLPVKAGDLASVTAIAAGGNHSLAIGSSGRVFAWGDNSYGQLGGTGETPQSKPLEVTGLSRAGAIAAGFYHSMVLLQDGSLYTFGRNDNGQLGDGTEDRRSSPDKVSLPAEVVLIAGGFQHSLAALEDGSLYAWGANFEGQLGVETGSSCGVDSGSPRPCSTTPLEVGDVGGISAIAGGYLHSLGVEDGVILWSWGANGSGQLGDGTTTSSALPVQIN